MLKIFTSFWAGLIVCLIMTKAPARTIHVSKSGNDKNKGTLTNPLLTINAAASIAKPCDTILVYKGIYREWVRPQRGGKDDNSRIIYMANPGDEVILRGSEEVKSWNAVGNGIWYKALSPGIFNNYNPYLTLMKRGRLPDNSRQRCLGEVYLNGTPLDEVSKSDSVKKQAMTWSSDCSGSVVIYANFGNKDPNAEMVEINVREQVFAPAKWNLGYITVKGFIIEHSANNYDDSFGKLETAPQKGALSTTGGHHWIIEDNTINHAKSIGIDWGVQGARAIRDHFLPDENHRGNHIIRHNTVINSGSNGMIGYMGQNTRITGNKIINSNRLRVQGVSKAGIKVIMNGHDILIENNYFYNNQDTYALWIDWANQGVKVSKNYFVESGRVFIEALHGPMVFENNILIKTGLRITDGGASLLAHNMFFNCGDFELLMFLPRDVPLYFPHSNRLIGFFPGHLRDLRFIGNIFIKDGLSIPEEKSSIYNNWAENNFYLDGASPSTRFETNARVEKKPTNFQYNADNQTASISFNVNKQSLKQIPLVTYQLVGDLNMYVKQEFSDILTDFFGDNRTGENNIPGPFLNLKDGKNNFLLNQ